MFKSAYHVQIIENEKDNGYLVICATEDNPSDIEYGYSASPKISPNSHTYYFTMGLYFDINRGTYRNMADNSTCGLKEMKEKYADVTASVSIPCSLAQKNLTNLRIAYKGITKMKGGGQWNILGELPSGTIQESGKLYKCLRVKKYFVTSDFQGTNHCGPTSGMNVLRYYSKRLLFSLLSSDTNLGLSTDTDIFNYLYTRMGNGGATFPNSYRSALKTYISARKNSSSGWSNVSISSASQTKTYSNIKNDVDKGRMAYLIIWNGLQAHYINVVGYYRYSTSDNVYVHVINNWNSKPNYYYLFRTGSSSYNSAISHMGYCKISK